MNAAHTPGPWRVGDYNEEHPDERVICATDSVAVVASVWPMGEDFDIGPESQPVPERDANARLIAAAPEMHAFLKMIDSWGYSVTQDSAADVVDKARALLARIRGAEVHS